MKNKLLIMLTILCQSTFAQVSESDNYFFAKEFSKEISLYRAKKFLIEQVLSTDENDVQFDIDPLAATNSGEVTSLGYKCEIKGIEGLLLGFYGDYWNKTGVVYQGYAFKNLTKDKALELLNKITETMENSKDYLFKNVDNNNVYFQFDDLIILLYASVTEPRIRIFWNDFDSEWTITAFKRTKKRFEKSLKSPD